MSLKDMVEHLWNSQRSLLVLLAVLFGINLILFVVIEKSLVPQVADQERLLLQKQNEIRQQVRKQSLVATTPEQLYLLARQDTSKFQEAIPDYQDFTGLIEELLVLSSRARLDINQISYTSTELKQGPLLKFSLNFNVAGDYEQVKKFIHSLEQSVRLITIKQMSLQSADDSGVSLRLSLETFFRAGERES